jgi:hypothetical protein
VTVNNTSTAVVVPYNSYEGELYFRGEILPSGEQRGIVKRSKVVAEKETLLDITEWDAK